MVAPKHTTSFLLLRYAIPELGLEPIARALGMHPATLQSFASGDEVMSLLQQRALALALLSLADQRQVLRRRAMRLLGQVSAAEQFVAGASVRHLASPTH